MLLLPEPSVNQALVELHVFLWFLKFEKNQTASHLAIWKPWPAAGHLGTEKTGTGKFLKCGYEI